MSERHQGYSFMERPAEDGLDVPTDEEIAAVEAVLASTDAVDLPEGAKDRLLARIEEETQEGNRNP